VIIVQQNDAKCQHFMSMFREHPMAKSTRIMPYSVALRQKLGFRELPVLIVQAGSPHQSIRQGDQCFAYLAQASSSSSAAAASTVPSESLMGYDVTVADVGYAFLSDDGSTFMGEHGGGALIDETPLSTPKTDKPTSRSNKSDGLMERFEELRAQYDATRQEMMRAP